MSSQSRSGALAGRRPSERTCSELARSFGHAELVEDDASVAESSAAAAPGWQLHLRRRGRADCVAMIVSIHTGPAVLRSSDAALGTAPAASGALPARYLCRIVRQGVPAHLLPLLFDAHEIPSGGGGGGGGGGGQDEGEREHGVVVVPRLWHDDATAPPNSTRRYAHFATDSLGEAAAHCDALARLLELCADALVYAREAKAAHASLYDNALCTDSVHATVACIAHNAHALHGTVVNAVHNLAALRIDLHGRPCHATEANLVAEIDTLLRRHGASKFFTTAAAPASVWPVAVDAGAGGKDSPDGDSQRSNDEICATLWWPDIDPEPVDVSAQPRRIGAATETGRAAAVHLSGRGGPTIGGVRDVAACSIRCLPGCYAPTPPNLLAAGFQFVEYYTGDSARAATRAWLPANAVPLRTRSGALLAMDKSGAYVPLASGWPPSSAAAAAATATATAAAAAPSGSAEWH